MLSNIFGAENGGGERSGLHGAVVLEERLAHLGGRHPQLRHEAHHHHEGHLDVVRSVNGLKVMAQVVVKHVLHFPVTIEKYQLVQSDKKDG